MLNNVVLIINFLSKDWVCYCNVLIYNIYCLKHSYDFVTGDGVSMIATQGALHPGYGEGQNDIGLLYMPKDIPFSG